MGGLMHVRAVLNKCSYTCPMGFCAQCYEGGSVGNLISSGGKGGSIENFILVRHITTLDW